MRIRFECRHCGAGLTASDWDSGRAILCSTCQGENIVPADQAPALSTGDDRVPNLAIARGVAVATASPQPLPLGHRLERARGRRHRRLLPRHGRDHDALGPPRRQRSAHRRGERRRSHRRSAGATSAIADEQLFKALADTPVKGLERETFTELRRSRPEARRTSACPGHRQDAVGRARHAVHLRH